MFYKLCWIRFLRFVTLSDFPGALGWVSMFTKYAQLWQWSRIVLSIVIHICHRPILCTIHTFVASSVVSNTGKYTLPLSFSALQFFFNSQCTASYLTSAEVHISSNPICWHNKYTFWSSWHCLIKIKSTVISVIMPPLYFYRKYAPPFFDGSFLNILR